MKTNSSLKAVVIFLLNTVIYLPISNAQNNVFPENGNVGIGTVTPLFKLDLTGSLRFGGSGSYSAMILGTEEAPLVGYNQTSYITPSTLPGSGIARSVFRFKNKIGGLGKTLVDVIVDGKVGIGTLNPKTSLYVQDSTTNYTTTVTLKNSANDIRARSGFTLENDSGNQTYFYKQASGNPDANDIILYSAQGKTRIYTGGSERFVIDNSGNIGIGTATPDVKLAVNGNIRAKEIKVETAGWPDYVFAKNYKLPSLKETESHIKEKGHLFGIPSAEEVKIKGIELGDMNAKLLKKIEELTLYMIELNKTVENQQLEINKLKQKN